MKKDLLQRTIASGLVKRVGNVAERDFVALPQDTLVGVAVKVMRARDVSSILVLKVIDMWNKPDGNDQNSTNANSVNSSLATPDLYSLSKEQLLGILTERDIIYRVLAENKGPYKVTIGQIMSSPLVTVGEDTSVRDAIALMQSKQIRRLPVISSDGSVMGIVTLKTVIGNMPSHNIDLAELESSRSVAQRESVCPYCRSVIGKSETMVGHMEDTHMRR